MRGHIVKPNEKRRLWYAVVDVGRGDDGKRKQKWLGGFKTRKEAQAALARALHDLGQGSYVEPSKQTAAEFLDEWLKAVRSTIRHSTWDSYRSNVEAHIVPRLGAIPLRHLGPERLNAFYAELLEDGRSDGEGGLSTRTVRYVHMILRRALKDAVRWGKLARNPADLADPPRPKGTQMLVWTSEQVRSFLGHVEEDRLFACYLLAATTGMRRGELLGLRWEDIDLEAGRLQVRATRVVVDKDVVESEPKTRRSRRSISLDAGTVAALRSHRASQLSERLAWGPGYQDSGLVFTREDGAPIHPQSLSWSFRHRVKRAGLPLIRFHDLRHTYATLALSAGVHPKIVSERLGHSSIAITLDTYSHVIPALAEQEANRVASMILPGKR